MKQTLQSIVVSCALVIAATPAQATPIDVRVLSASYSVTVTIGVHPDHVIETKTSTDLDPVTESLSSVGGIYGYAEANATADFLDVWVDGFSLPATPLYTISSADTRWTFSPVEDGVADFGILWERGHIFVLLSATLVDVTTNAQVWEFSSLQYGLYLSETVPTFLDADHVYAMNLTASAESRGDGVYGDLHLSGVRAVPDDVDSFMCLCLGLLVVLLGKRVLT
jgi:hypothetical protein